MENNENSTNVITGIKRHNSIRDIFLSDNSWAKDEIEELKENHYLIIDKGYEYIEKSQYKKALHLFLYGIQTDKKDPDLLNGLGIALSELGAIEKSKSIFKIAAKLNPEDGITYANLAGAYWEEGQFDKAIHFYNKAIELDDDIQETHLNLINLYIETGAFYMAFITTVNFLQKHPENEEGQELKDEIILNLAMSMY